MWAKKAHELRTCTSNRFWEKSDQTRIKRTWHITYIKWNNWSPSNCYIPMHRAERKWTKIKITADCKIICVHGTNAIKFMWDTKITSTCYITLFFLNKKLYISSTSNCSAIVYLLICTFLHRIDFEILHPSSTFTLSQRWTPSSLTLSPENHSITQSVSWS